MTSVAAAGPFIDKPMARLRSSYMTRLEALILRAAAAWTIFIWATRIKNILENPVHSTGFKAVHSGLAAVSIIFACALLYIASRNRRRAKL